MTVTITKSELAALTRRPARPKAAKVAVPSTADWDGFELTFVVPGKPQAWQRPGGGTGRRFTEHATRDAEKVVGQYAALALGRRLPLSCSVELGLWFYLPDRRARDLDNLEKLVKDALNGIAWLDDRQVTDTAKLKRVDPANPRTIVRVRPAAADAQASWAG